MQLDRDGAMMKQLQAGNRTAAGAATPSAEVDRAFAAAVAAAAEAADCVLSTPAYARLEAFPLEEFHIVVDLTVNGWAAADGSSRGSGAAGNGGTGGHPAALQSLQRFRGKTWRLIDVPPDWGTAPPLADPQPAAPSKAAMPPAAPSSAAQCAQMAFQGNESCAQAHSEPNCAPGPPRHCPSVVAAADTLPAEPAADPLPVVISSSAAACVRQRPALFGALLEAAECGGGAAAFERRLGGGVDAVLGEDACLCVWTEEMLQARSMLLYKTSLCRELCSFAERPLHLALPPEPGGCAPSVMRDIAFTGCT